LDVQTGAYVNSLENTDVKKLTKAVKEPIMTDKTLTEAADEDESQKSENENGTTTNPIRKTKRERIAELLEEGKAYGEIARAVGTSVGHVKYVAWELKKEQQKSENENNTNKLTLFGGGGDEKLEMEKIRYEA
jgi:DNA-binding NarL/FixJ family response regulator